MPFTLDWTEGLCKHCGTAHQLGAVRFTDADHVWAVGFWAPRGAGVPNPYVDTSEGYIIVHSLDGGRIWKEVSSTGMHTGEPAFSFVDALQGWVSGMSPIGESWVLRTIDGGRHWIQVSDQDLQAMVFLDATHGYGKSGNQFLRSTDAGKTWSESVLPQVHFIDQMYFLNQSMGWLAGSDGEDAVILRTSDGGVHWEEARVHTGRKVAEVRDVHFLNAQQGWLITWHSAEEGTRLFRTQDGGVTWKADPATGFQGPHNWLAGVRFIGDKFVFAYGRQEAGEGKDKDKGMLIYSRDGGDHWQKFDTPRRIYDCQAVEGSLLCSALSGGSGLWLLKVHPLLANGK